MIEDQYEKADHGFTESEYFNFNGKKYKSYGCSESFFEVIQEEKTKYVEDDSINEFLGKFLSKIKDYKIKRLELFNKTIEEYQNNKKNGNNTR